MSLGVKLPQYWINLYTTETWNEYKAAGSKAACFRESMWKSVQKVKKGDILLCYLTGLSRFVGAQEVDGAPFQDQSRIYKSDVFPSRLPIVPIIELEAEFGVPIKEFLTQLSIFDAKRPNTWTGRLRGSPTKWSEADGRLIVDYLERVKLAPVSRPVLEAKKRVPKAVRPYQAKMGEVTVPEELTREPTAHDEIQWLLLEFGSSIGLDVWVARNDRGKSYLGSKFVELPRLKESLPLSFDDATNRTIELIDVLWLKGNTIVAAFEIESTTSIYSGLLRMSDLVAMQPNLNIPLYLVAPDERRQKVFEEVNRPTFRRLNPPLRDACRFIAFSILKMKLSEAKPVLQFIKPEILEAISEDCSM